MAKIEDAIVHLLTNHGTFYASLLSQMVRVINRKEQTLHTEIRNGHIELHYNPDFLEPKPMKESIALLEHECLHPVMEHFDRFKDKEHDLAMVATDLAINQLLPYTPPYFVTLDNFFGANARYNIKSNESAEYYYDLIKKSKELTQKAKDLVGNTGQGQGNGEGECDGTCKPDKNGKGGGGHQHSCGNDFNKSDGTQGVDSEFQKEIVRQAVREAVNTAKANGQGDIPMGLEQYIDELFKPPELNWKQLLRKFIAASIKSGHKASWKKQSRRYGEGTKGRVSDRTVSLVVAIDTSGSINDEMLTDFITEIKGIQACYKSEIHMIECDAEVQKYYKLQKYKKVDRNILGRGGTDFRPVFKYIKAKNIRCDALIFFTDLAGTFPDKKPPYPTIWGYYNPWSHRENLRDLAPFGYVIQLKQERKK